MYKKSIATLLVLGCSVTGSAFANGFLEKLFANNNTTKHSIIKIHTKSAPSDRFYTDFSGTWVADCGSYQYETTIKNDDGYITLDGHEYKIGRGLRGFYESNEYETGQYFTSFEWGEDRSTLTMKQTGVSKDHHAHSNLETRMVTLTMSMNKGQISLDGKSAYAEDLTEKIESRDMHCVLTKKL